MLTLLFKKFVTNYLNLRLYYNQLIALALLRTPE
jgi:hypothetical protein